MKSLVLLTASVLFASAAVAEGTKTSMPNPAATFCIENDGTYQLRKNEDGSVYGVCILKDGTEVDAWDYLRSHFEQ
ncbi:MULTISPECIES: DUF333 domain-containing protein [unclassified Ruegeria]|uniref:putative hemolysin n=1 Tax=unclassified Ruegeria TaxID=2625375 RepID=UPI00148776BD|nr:DUF333 domain-containing protein [Ruegeria sp. HKCCD6109]NOD74653.1 DUF333 domain-containing protein [Ruegeria sp. HKCCD4332]NOD88613.1 DUF333 domain-containing protein [Ruegeria sp. HKCCD4318]NOE12159.1 DUF333 domain-containing protein [Ruegeria sp. HKCCD4318-2]NOG09676.1 DUF333 domain-containing protein [Ruegeria sp. HKCCD4315]